MHSRSLKLALAFLLAVFVISALPAWAQSTNTGTVVGSVTDPTGAVVSGATVTITDISTGNARTDATNSAGRYIFVDVNPGIYKLAITKAGFQTTQTERLEVKVGAAVTVNLTLTVGGASTVVEVTAVGNELQTMNATIGNTITSLTIDNLPSLGRDVSTFVELQPGVGPDGSVAGAVLDQSYFSLDGGNNTNDMDGSMNVYTMSYAGDPTGGVATQNNLGAGSGGPTGVLPTPQDSVEEFKVNTAGQTADFNSSAGSEVKVVTKRGTNAWHGTGYEYYKDNNWSSQTWQNNFGGVGLPSFHYNRFGGAIGGPLIPKEVLGGKTYVFFNYEGFHWPLSQTIQRNIPSTALRQGLLTDDTTGAFYNLNPYSVVYNGITYPGTALDPRGIGIDPLVQAIFNTYAPPVSTTPCQQSLCDTSLVNPPNIAGFSANIATPTKSRFMVGRVDHDFSKNWHFMSSYRVYRLSSDTTDQVDIGGALPGDALGTPASLSNVPQNAAIWVASLTTNVTANVTNDVHYSFLRNWWQWQRAGDPPQPVPTGLAGSSLAGALEIFSGQSATQDLGPYNVNTQQTRTRFWDGHDQMVRDDISWLKGNHLLQLGGTYQHNFNWHSRTDNGGGINYEPVYELGKGAAGSGLSSPLPLCSDPTVAISNCDSLTAAALGIVSLAQTAFTRTGANLTLNPPLTPAFDKVVIPYYNTYFSDTWHMKPSFTLTYGLGWTLEMPPTEANGKSVVLVDQANQPVSTLGYLASRRRAALAGENYNPEIGFALIGNVGNSPKYPYNPFYGEFSPRIAAAWSPHFEGDTLAAKLFGREDTVIRGGYGRVYGRLNGVDLVLVPLLGTGLIQPVQNLNPIIGPAGVPSSANNAFRIGTDGLAGGVYSAPLPTASATLPQPDYPGFNAIPAATGEGLDPNFRPNVVDSFNLTVQRQLSRKVTLEFGYIGRRITHEYQPINLNAVPYMTTMGGQTFSNAYKNVVLQYCGGIAGLAGGNCAANSAAVQSQPFFESGMSAAYCAGYTSCTAAVVAREGNPAGTGGGNFGLAQVWSLWSDIDSGAGCAGCVVTNSNGVPAGQGFATLGNTMMNTVQGPYNGGSPQMTSGASLNASVGYGNYNAGFFSLKMADWRGLTAQSNFTYSKALGTGADVQATSEYTPDDPFNLGTMYGYQNFNRKFVYNFFFVYQPPFFKGQHGIVGRALGGWTFSSIFTAGTGSPIEFFTSTGDGQEYGAGDNINFFGNENAVQIAPIKGGHRYNQPGGFPSLFAVGGNAQADFRNPILGLDNKNGGNGNYIGLNYWNMDFSVRKNVMITEGVSLEFQGVFANVLNHDQFLDPAGVNGSGLFSGSCVAQSCNSGFGSLVGGSAQEQIGGIRQIELGARVRF